MVIADPSARHVPQFDYFCVNLQYSYYASHYHQVVDESDASNWTGLRLPLQALSRDKMVRHI